MYFISVESSFSAAHFLRGYHGKCENLHGHRFKVVARLRVTKLNEIGLAYDFAELKKQLGDVLEKYDHCCLNEVAPFDNINPSSENIAATIYERLLPSILPGSFIDSIEVWESPESCAVYKPG
jgi:6-pyruvoyltetrahydropterin/6-carboxytetrahydropterin synthase